METYIILSLSVFVVMVLYFVRKYFQGKTFCSSRRLHGKTVLITGANTGIGKEAAIDLAKRGARVIIACRDKTRGAHALEDIKQQANSQQVYLEQLDLASFKSVRDFVERFKKNEAKLNILINNAGTVAKQFTLTEDGFELIFAVNHLGHFLLTNLLLDMIEKSAPSRIVTVSSKGHFRAKTVKFAKEDINNRENYTPFQAYCESKLANILFTRELGKRLEGKGVTTYSLHPGVVDTEIFRYVRGVLKILFHTIKPLFFKTSKQGAQTTIYCAVAEELEGVSGKYYADCSEVQMSGHAMDDDAARKLWDASMDFVGI